MMGLSPIEKFDVLVANVTAVVNAHGAPFNIDTRTRDYNLLSTSDFDRNDVMGNPIRYGRIESLDLEAPTSGLSDFNEGPVILPSRYIMGFWLERIDADTYDASSQKTFDDFLWNEADPGPVGLLRYLFDAVCWLTPTDQIRVGNPTDVMWPLAEPNSAQHEWSHMVQLTITLY